MQRQDSGANERGINVQFGDLMRERREYRGWSQRQLAEMLQSANLHLDPSAVTRIERGTRDVKLAEAIAIASVLGFNLDGLVFSAEQHFIMRERSEIELVIRARKALLDAIRHIDQWANNTDPETEKELVKKRKLADVAELYVSRLRQAPAFQRGGRLGPVEGDNFAIYYNDEDFRVKQSIAEIVIDGILMSEEEFEEIAAMNRRKLGRGLASLIPTNLKGEADDSET